MWLQNVTNDRARGTAILLGSIDGGPGYLNWDGAILNKKRIMKKIIDLLKRHKVSMTHYNSADFTNEIDSAIRVLSVYSHDQEPQVPRKLDAVGMNGLINALMVMRDSGINAIEIVDCEDGSLKIKELK